MTRIQIVFVLCGVALVTSLSTAHADDEPPCAAEAKVVANMKTRDPSLAPPTNSNALVHMEAAKNAYGVGDHDRAIREYMDAGRLDSAPRILYNLGQTYRDAKEYEKAIRQYKLFIQRGKPGKEVEAVVQCFIRHMTAELEQSAATAPPTGPDGGTEPADPDEGAKDLTGHWTPKRKIGVGVAAGGAVALGLGVLFGVQTNALKDDAAQICPDPSTPCDRADEANSLSDRAGTRAFLANVSLGVGGAMLVGGAVLWFLGAPSSTDEEHATLAPRIAPEFTGVVWSGRF